MLIPQENEKDLAEIPKNIKDKLTIIPVKWIDQVLQHALTHMPLARREVAIATNAPAGKAGERTRKALSDVVRPPLADFVSVWRTRRI